jgi:hypothetical protein
MSEPFRTWPRPHSGRFVTCNETTFDAGAIGTIRGTTHLEFTNRLGAPEQVLAGPHVGYSVTPWTVPWLPERWAWPCFPLNTTAEHIGQWLDRAIRLIERRDDPVSLQEARGLVSHAYMLAIHLPDRPKEPSHVMDAAGCLAELRHLRELFRAKPVKAKRPPRKGITKEEAHKLMMKAIEKDSNLALTLTSHQWAKHIGCSSSTIAKTELWRQLEANRQKNKQERMPSNRGRRRPQHTSNADRERI